MKTLIAMLLATAASAGHAAAPTAALNHDPAAYRALTQKAQSDYQAAVAKCGAKGGNDQDVCTAEARVARVRAENEALARYYNTPKGRAKMRTDLADAEYDLAKARCGAKSGADKDECVNNAKSIHSSAVADAKADRPSTGASAGGDTASGSDQVKAGAAAVVEKTKEVAHEVAEKTKEAAAGATVADAAITTKVKAGLIKEPGLESLGIHVETEKGVVMLSGFVNSQAEEDKAVKVAKGVDGVATVRSAIKVK